MCMYSMWISFAGSSFLNHYYFNLIVPDTKKELFPLLHAALSPLQGTVFYYHLNKWNLLLLARRIQKQKSQDHITVLKI